MTIIGFTVMQWCAIAWFIGALYANLLPYFRKWWRQGKNLSFNPGYIINMVISTVLGVTTTMTLFLVWEPPDVIAPLLIIIAFLTGAGVDASVIQEIMKIFDVYQKVWEHTRGKNQYPVTSTDIETTEPENKYKMYNDPFSEHE